MPLEQGQVLDPAVVADGPALGAGQVAMSLAVAPEHAAAGQLRAGDQVAGVASGKPDQPAGGATEPFDTSTAAGRMLAH